MDGGSDHEGMGWGRFNHPRPGSFDHTETKIADDWREVGR
ncbi:hypothetical protein SAMN05192561_1234 [Halopenitus malekzadehii]|uniref:Uncharacterized protein n=1 Tax=Halopenitus malekzadehii TaxID=1267564 RepID=A0A1H6K0P8_9EURY|nr:hypothetical protein SAMN05192561_1234 [Halopenitus malekzadehii]